MNIPQILYTWQRHKFAENQGLQEFELHLCEGVHRMKVQNETNKYI